MTDRCHSIASAEYLKALQDKFKAEGAACPTCDNTRQLHGYKDLGEKESPRYELLWQCWKCAWTGQEYRYDNWMIGNQADSVSMQMHSQMQNNDKGLLQYADVSKPNK